MIGREDGLMSLRQIPRNHHATPTVHSAVECAALWATGRGEARPSFRKLARYSWSLKDPAEDQPTLLWSLQ